MSVVLKLPQEFLEIDRARLVNIKSIPHNFLLSSAQFDLHSSHNAFHLISGEEPVLIFIEFCEGLLSRHSSFGKHTSHPCEHFIFKAEDRIEHLKPLLNQSILF